MTTTGLGFCNRPPKGWACPRPRHHDGPCAAVPMSISNTATAGGKTYSMSIQKKELEVDIPIFQTTASKRRGFWHLAYIHPTSGMSALCHVNLVVWNKQGNIDKWKSTFKGNEPLCPACVEQAYIAGMIDITFKNRPQ
jgi:hypothetical protein